LADFSFIAAGGIYDFLRFFKVYLALVAYFVIFLLWYYLLVLVYCVEFKSDLLEVLFSLAA